MLGTVHKELCQWMTRDDKFSHQLVLLPRDHQKSAMAAYYVAWKLTKNPALRVLYISATANLAEKQLKFIKDILTSNTYRFYWPEMINTAEGAREKWTSSEISVDHPLRDQEHIRDPSIFTAGLTTVITGLHADLCVLDDVVVGDNADTEEGRLKVSTQVSYLASILGSEGEILAVGTRYHPKDEYNNMQNMTYEDYDEEGNPIGTRNLYEVFERQVEDRGDGRGQFIWPRMQRQDGKWFGFNASILAKKKSQYTDLSKFRAQYYNNPNDRSSAPINSSMFQYYDKKNLARYGSHWHISGRKLNVVAAVDFAYSTRRRADWTCITVVGIDALNNYYILDIDRFQTDKISDYFDRILRLHTKWDFRKLRAEVTAAQQVIVEDLKTNYIRPNGLAITILEHRPTRHEGTKEERMEAILQPKYANRQVYHYRGGNCELLEEELSLLKPPHDDIKDTVASAFEACVAPSLTHRSDNVSIKKSLSHSRFGGIA